jgi:CubicO group peptidase (beta-lactamase class C family)
MLPIPFDRRSRVPPPDEVTTVRVEAETDPRDVGVDPAALGRVWDAARRLYASGIHPAMSICVRRSGRVLLDRAVGHAVGNGPDDPPDAPRRLATPDTPFCLASTSKAITAMVLHQLDERGALRMDDPVCEYLPEFGCHGKEEITIRHILAHRAGVPNTPPDSMDPDLLARPDEIVQLLCEQWPLWRPGTRLGYHAVTTGFLLGEIVRRVTGRDIRTYIADEMMRPLGMRWMSYGVAPEEVDLVARNYRTGPPPLPPISTLLHRALGVDYATAVETLNDPRFLTSVFPSANVVATADEVSRFFEMLRRGGEVDGVRVLDPRTVKRAVLEQSYLEIDLTLILPFRYSMGFMLGAHWFSLYGPGTPRAFGHLGLTNIFGWADPEREVAAAILTSGKPVIYPEIFWLFEVLRRIGNACTPVVH